MQTTPFAFALPLQDPTSGRSVDVQFSGSFEARGTDPMMAQHAQQAVAAAAQSVLGGRLMRNELALPTLAPSLPYLTGEIAQQAGSQLAFYGVQLGNLQMQAQVPPLAPMQSVPTPQQALAQSVNNAAARQLQKQVPTGVKIQMGGFSVGLGSAANKTPSLGDQLKEKVQDKLIGCAIVGGVVLVLGVITMVVIAKIVLMG